MAGHSKWSNIKRRKGAQDVKRGKIFMQHSRDIYSAAKEGGADPEMNASLRLAMEKARAANMPKDNVERAIKKATGTLDGAVFEEIAYEGYGPGGVAVIIDILTDNRNRTAAEIRHAFSVNNGNLGETGSVRFMFDRKGYIGILDEDHLMDEDEITMAAIEAGADDIVKEDGGYAVYTAVDTFESVCEHLQTDGYELEDAEVTLIAQNYNEISGEDEKLMLQLLDTLEDNEDVQAVHHNLEISE